MRIVAGRFRGQTLTAPKGDRTRPTTDRTREALFNVLAHSGDGLEDARVLDLFAGSGALGLEALSRGAAFALFVDDAPAARGAIRQNVETLGVQGRTRIFRRNATKLGPLPAAFKHPFDLIFCDPPYGRGLAARALTSALEGGWLAAGARIAVEQAKDAPEDVPEGFVCLETRNYGDTKIAFLAIDAG